MKVLINCAVLLALSAPFSIANNHGSESDYTPRKTYTPSNAITEIYKELRGNPEKYDLERAGKSQRAAIREYGEERAYPLLKKAILEQEYLIQVRRYFFILMETEKGRMVAEETALELLGDESVDTPKQLVALGVIGDLRNSKYAPLVRTYLNSEDENIRLKAAEILDSWEVDPVIEISPTPPASATEGVTQKSSESKPATQQPAEPAEKSSQWWLWLIGALVVLGGVGLVLRRKS